VAKIFKHTNGNLDAYISFLMILNLIPETYIRLSSPFCIRALFHLAGCRRQRCHSKIEPTSDIFLRTSRRRQ